MPTGASAYGPLGSTSADASLLSTRNEADRLQRGFVDIFEEMEQLKSERSKAYSAKQAEASEARQIRTQLSEWVERVEGAERATEKASCALEEEQQSAKDAASHREIEADELRQAQDNSEVWRSELSSAQVDNTFAATNLSLVEESSQSAAQRLSRCQADFNNAEAESTRCQGELLRAQRQQALAQLKAAEARRNRLRALDAALQRSGAEIAEANIEVKLTEAEVQQARHLQACERLAATEYESDSEIRLQQSSVAEERAFEWRATATVVATEREAEAQAANARAVVSAKRVEDKRSVMTPMHQRAQEAEEDWQACLAQMECVAATSALKGPSNNAVLTQADVDALQADVVRAVQERAIPVMGETHSQQDLVDMLSKARSVLDGYNNEWRHAEGRMEQGRAELQDAKSKPHVQRWLHEDLTLLTREITSLRARLGRAVDVTDELKERAQEWGEALAQGCAPRRHE